MNKYICICKIVDGTMTPNYIYNINDVIMVDDSLDIKEINGMSITKYIFQYFNESFIKDLSEIKSINIGEYFLTLAEWRNNQIDNILDECNE